MIDRLLRASLASPAVVIGLALLVVVAGIQAIRHMPLDAIPDLSDTQVIIRTGFPGQAPQVVEDQVTYPIATAMLAVPGATDVRGYSFFGDSFVYVLFEDGTDPYWARSRVLEYLDQVGDQLPPGVQPRLGPDASGVGWIYQYALVDRSGGHDLAQLRSLQDWFLKYELQTVPGVAEVATVGGMVKQYQVVVDPGLQQMFNVTLEGLRESLRAANREVSGSVLEMGEAEYMIRGRGYITSLEDLRAVPYVGRRQLGTPMLLSDMAEIRLGPAPRRGIADLDGEGEVVGGIVVMRWGANALETIARVKEKLAQLHASLPAGVEIVETYDRSGLIHRAVDTLRARLTEEFVVVSLVCLLFLGSLRAALVVVLTLPVGVLAALLIMHGQGITANIMSLGGIAIAIGAMVDAAIVMVENVHRRLEAGLSRQEALRTGLREVAMPLFFSLLIITLSFLPVLALEHQEGRLFRPLALTKTWAMAAATLLSVTLVPALLAVLLRGAPKDARESALNRLLVRGYRPALAAARARPGLTLLLAMALVASAAWPLARLGGEFLPPLEEGDLLYMPTTLPGVSIDKARELLQQTDRLIRTVPEVARVFGKAGRAETATDPAPLTMIETTIRLRPESEWRPGMTLEKLREELDRIVRVPGITNAWLMPISARIDMLSTGIKTPVGIKISGPDLAGIQRIGEAVEQVLRGLPGTRSVYSERVDGGRYIDIEVDRMAAARHDLSLRDVQDVITLAIGGETVTWTVEGRERYPVNLRYPRRYRDSIDRLRELPVLAPGREYIRLSDVAHIRVADGPAVIKSENARLNGWVYVDLADPDLLGWVRRAQRAVANHVSLPPGYALEWSGQYEYLVRARAKMAWLVPMVVGVIVLLLYLIFRRWMPVLLVLATLPLALVGAVWLMWLLGQPLSVASLIGLIALGGVAAEFGVVMLIYLDQAVARRRPADAAALRAAIEEGAVLRVRPKAMTVAVILVGLLPILLGSGAGSEVMRRIATPMIGGMLTAPLVSLLLIPVLYERWLRHRPARLSQVAESGRSDRPETVPPGA